MRAWIGSASALLLLASAATGQTILVYDSGNHLQCWGAAQAKYPGSSTLATNADFTTKLQSGVYDVVVASAPSGLLPSGAWPALSNFVGGGGRAALSFWDWDNDAGYGDPLLLTAFEVTAASSINSLQYPDSNSR